MTLDSSDPHNRLDNPGYPFRMDAAKRNFATGAEHHERRYVATDRQITTAHALIRVVN